MIGYSERTKKLIPIILILSVCLLIVNISIAMSTIYSKSTIIEPDIKDTLEQSENYTRWSPWWKMGYFPYDNISITLYTGWNLIGWYHEYDTTASSLAGNISGCEMVSRFDAINQTYRTYIAEIGPITFDFVITQGMGLFIYVNTSSIWHGEG